MEDKCPECGNFLITKTIKKQLGTGSIDYPVSQMCPKCNWSKDLTGAGDIVARPQVFEGREAKEEETSVMKSAPVEPPEVKPSSIKQMPVKTHAPKPADFNRTITVALAILVIIGVIWAFSPRGQEPAEVLPPVQTPAVTPTPAITVQTPVPEVTPTGNKTFVKLDRDRIYKGATSIIKPGDEVIWVNDGSYGFTLLSNDIPDFGARTLDNGKQTSYMFKKPGTYSFYLEKNRNVNGTIVVRA